MWNFTIKEAQPYLDEMLRWITFREGVIGFLGIKTDKDTEDAYCRACKAAGKNKNCSTCDKDITVESKEKVIGKK